MKKGRHRTPNSELRTLSIEADERALRMFTSTLPVSDFTRDVKPPAGFVVGRVTDTWVAGRDK